MSLSFERLRSAIAVCAGGKFGADHELGRGSANSTVQRMMSTERAFIPRGPALDVREPRPTKKNRHAATPTRPLTLGSYSI
jgi:hypothetical protein